MDGYTIAWLLWLAMFGVVEGIAVFNKQAGDTLSEHVWKWFSIRDKGKGWLARRTVLGGFLVWLLLHMMGVGG